MIPAKLLSLCARDAPKWWWKTAKFSHQEKQKSGACISSKIGAKWNLQSCGKSRGYFRERCDEGYRCNGLILPLFFIDKIEYIEKCPPLYNLV